MLRHVLFDVNLFPDESERASSQKRVLCLLEALTWLDQIYLSEHPETPLIYQSGIKYSVPEQFEQANLPEVAAVREFLMKKSAGDDVMVAFDMMADQVGSGEHFRDIPRIIENGGGDCDNVASWRCAELRHLGVTDAKPYITSRKRADGGTTYHVIVRWPDGSSEDPSLLLGMGGADRAAQREEEVRKLHERNADFVAGLLQTRNLKTALDGIGSGAAEILGLQAATPFSAQGGTPSDFGQGLQYTLPFESESAYEDWSPTQPSALWQNPYYKSGLTAGTPFFNTLMRDPDEDWEERNEDRFDGHRVDADEFDGVTRSKIRGLVRRLKRAA